MYENRGRSTFAGMLIGLILGNFIFAIDSYMLILGRHADMNMIPAQARMAWGVSLFWLGTVPGLVIGAIGGLVTPITVPRGYLSKSIGALLFIVVTALVWIFHYHDMQYLSEGRKTWAVIFNVLMLFFTIPASQLVGMFLEGIRE